MCSTEKYASHAPHAWPLRKKSVRRKLNAMALEFAGKNVLIVDGEPSNSPSTY